MIIGRHGICTVVFGNRNHGNHPVVNAGGSQVYSGGGYSDDYSLAS